MHDDTTSGAPSPADARTAEGPPAGTTYAPGNPGLPEPAAGRDGVSVAALITGIIGAGIIPVVLGFMGLKRTKRDRTRGRGMAIAGIVLGILWMIGGAVWVFVNADALQPSAADRDEASGEITAGSDADVFSLQVGDCLDMSAVAAAESVDSMPTVPCDEEHDAELFHEITLEGESFPTDVTDQADQGCTAAFADFIGLDYMESALELSYLHPTSDSWDQGDRTIQCIVISSELVTGTMQSAGI